MRLVLTEYLSSLRERDELDVIIPNLLSQMGLNVFSTPLQGGREYGVDVAAIGKIDGNEKKVYLFSIKAGDLDRQEWDTRPQSLRQSLNDIKDVYLRLRLPKEYEEYPIVICPTFGGRMKTEVRDNYEGYIRDNCSSKISFEEWNGAKIAEGIEKYLLSDSLFIRNDKEIDFRSLLRKSLAMVEEPEVSIHNFNQIINLLCIEYEKEGQALTAMRQLYLANGILFNWAKSEENIKSALLASERSVLFAWEVVKKYKDKTTKVAQQIWDVFQRLMGLYSSIMSSYDSKLIEGCRLEFGISWLINSNCDVDVNLKLFEIIGRLSLSGLWGYFLYENFASDAKAQEELLSSLELKVEVIKQIILNNPLSYSPYSDDQAIDLMLLVLFLKKCDVDEVFIKEYLIAMTNQIGYLFSSNGRYPTIFTDYKDLYNHPKNTKEYLDRAVAGSILYPFMQLVSSIENIDEVYDTIEASRLNFLKDCTFQTWFPDDFSEDNYFTNKEVHGKVLIHSNYENEEVPISKYRDQIYTEINATEDFKKLSAIEAGIYPLLLTASYHYRIPVPPQFFFEEIGSSKDNSTQTP